MEVSPVRYAQLAALQAWLVDLMARLCRLQTQLVCLAPLPEGTETFEAITAAREKCRDLLRALEGEMEPTRKTIEESLKK